MSIKIKRAINKANIFKGDATVTAILKQIPEQLVKNLSSNDLALVIGAVNKAYQNGRASTGAEMVDNDCVWIESIGKLIEWSEVGAEYEQRPFKEESKYNDGIFTIGTRPVKVKDGELVPRFTEK